MDEGKLWTAPQVAKYFGFNRVYVSRLAKEAYKRGEKWPIKESHPYEAPLSAWHKILNQPDKAKRKPRKKSVERNEDSSIKEGVIKGIPAAQAARKFGYSSSWASKLSRRSRKKGNQWPIWNENRRTWIAPEEEWEKIFEDPKLKAWQRKK